MVSVDGVVAMRRNAAPQLRVAPPSRLCLLAPSCAVDGSILQVFPPCDHVNLFLDRRIPGSPKKMSPAGSFSEREPNDRRLRARVRCSGTTWGLRAYDGDRREPRLDVASTESATGVEVLRRPAQG